MITKIDEPTMMLDLVTPSWVDVLKSLGTDADPEFFWLTTEVDEVDDDALAFRGASL